MGSWESDTTEQLTHSTEFLIYPGNLQFMLKEAPDETTVDEKRCCWSQTEEVTWVDLVLRSCNHNSIPHSLHPHPSTRVRTKLSHCKGKKGSIYLSQFWKQMAFILKTVYCTSCLRQTTVLDTQDFFLILSEIRKLTNYLFSYFKWNKKIGLSFFYL